MNSKTNIPHWLSDGPKDIEYCTYKLRGAVSDLKKKLMFGNLVECLHEIDATLDYLYMYDAVKITQTSDPLNQIVGGLELPGLEMFFTSDDHVEDNYVLDAVLDEAIDRFEELHAMCRERWRQIEEGLKCSYVPSKPYFLNDGFVFIKTPDDMMHVYHFTKPNKYFTQDWKKFSMTHMYDEKWTNEVYYARLEEIISKESEKIILKVDCKTETILENNAIGVINHMIFSMLHRDYSF